jgi:gluconate kinase
MKATHLVGWTPIRIFWQQSAPFVDWVLLGEQRPTEPFFEQTIGQAMHHPFNMLFRHRTPVAALKELQQINPGVPPKGFIFHMSRCGSTLVSQMLASLPENIVLSEATPIDAVLRAHAQFPQITDEQRMDWLRGLVSALGQKRHEEEQDLFIKFDSWHMLDLPLIERAFPGVPWIFLYREPVEVMASHLRSRGGQMLPGYIKPEWLDLDMETVSRLSLDEYCARVLAKFCETALRYRDLGQSLLVNYRQLPDIFFSSLLDHFRVSYTPDELARMRRVMQFHAKSPAMTFTSDTADKQRAVTEEVRQLAALWIDPLYEELEAARQAQVKS